MAKFNIRHPTIGINWGGGDSCTLRKPASVTSSRSLTKLQMQLEVLRLMLLRGRVWQEALSKSY